MSILQVFTLLGALGMFLYGMNLMSSGLQKAAGNKLRGFLSAMTSNPFKGVMTGLGITALIQSSSATTVMVVSFVNAGLLTLVQAIGVIMGANIGTTVTAWLVAWLGFKADISILAIPLMIFGFLFYNSNNSSQLYRYDIAWKPAFGVADQLGKWRSCALPRRVVHGNHLNLRNGTRYASHCIYLERVRTGRYTAFDTGRRTWYYHHYVGADASLEQKNGHQ